MSDSVPTTSKIEVTHTRLKGPSGVTIPASAQMQSGQVSVHMTVESFSYDHWALDPKDTEAASATAMPDKDIKGPGMIKNTVEIRTNSSLCDPADAIELNALKRELDFYKLHTQILLQTKVLLEEKLMNVTHDFEDLKESLHHHSSERVIPQAESAYTSRKSSAVMAESPEELRFSLSPPGSVITSRKNSRRSLGSSGRNSLTAFHSAMENITYGVTEEFKNTASSPVLESHHSFDAHRRTEFSASLPRYPQRAQYTLNRLTSQDSFRTESSSDHYALLDTSPVSEELCRHFLKGRCRYKRLCKFSHEVVTCPYCQIELPQAKIAASTHLSRCYKANGKPNASGSNDEDLDQDDE